MDPSNEHEPHRVVDASATSLLTILGRWRLLTVVGMAAIAASLVALLVTHERTYEPALRMAIEASRSVRETHEAMLDQETSLRAYLVTGEEDFLRVYQRSANRLDALNARAEEVAGEVDPSRTLSMRLSQQAWIDAWVPAALEQGRAVEAGEPVDGVAVERLLQRGRELFDRYRAAQVDLQEALTRNRTDAMADQTRAITRTAGFALTLAVVLAVASAWRGAHLRRSVKAGLSGVLAHLDRIRSGNLDPVEPLRGPLELALIDAGISATARELRAAGEQLAGQTDRLRTQNHQLGQVLGLAREVAGSLNLGYVVRGVCAAAHAIVSEQVVVWLRSHDDGHLYAASDSEAENVDASGHEPVELGAGNVGRAARFGRTQGLVTSSVVDGSGARDGASIAVPMVVGAEVIGVLEVCGEGVAMIPMDTVQVLEALAVQAATAIGAARVHEHTELLAMTDALTHLPNRRRLEVDLAQEVAVSTRHSRPLAVAMIDVDHFKAYNDALGHPAADVALQDLARLLMANVRTGDRVYRYGGEELVVVMRETDIQGAAHHAERLCRLVEHHFAAPDQPRALTVSVGVAALPDHGPGGDALVAAADAALYIAKRTGRNRIATAGDA